MCLVRAVSSTLIITTTHLPGEGMEKKSLQCRKRDVPRLSWKRQTVWIWGRRQTHSGWLPGGVDNGKGGVSSRTLGHTLPEWEVRLLPFTAGVTLPCFPFCLVLRPLLFKVLIKMGGVSFSYYRCPEVSWRADFRPCPIWDLQFHRCSWPVYKVSFCTYVKFPKLMKKINY